MQRFEDLAIWQRSQAAARAVYRWTKSFPSDERFGLVSQLRRAAVSVPTNIAEGCHRFHATDFARFLNMAEGSLCELRSLIRLAIDLEYGAADEAKRLVREAMEISAMVYRFRQSVQAREPARVRAGKTETPRSGGA